MWIGNCWRDSLEGATDGWISDLCRGVRRVIARPAAGCWFPRCRTGEFQVTTKMKLLQSNLTWKVFFFSTGVSKSRLCFDVTELFRFTDCILFIFYSLTDLAHLSVHLSCRFALPPLFLSLFPRFYCLVLYLFTPSSSPPPSLSPLPSFYTSTRTYLSAHVFVHQSISVHTDR